MLDSPAHSGPSNIVSNILLISFISFLFTDFLFADLNVSRPNRPGSVLARLNDVYV